MIRTACGFLAYTGMAIVILLEGISTIFQRNKDLKVDEKTKESWRKKGLI